MIDMSERLDKKALKQAIIQLLSHQSIAIEPRKLNQFFLNVSDLNYLAQLNDFFSAEQLRIRQVKLTPDIFKSPTNHYLVFLGKEKRPCAIIAKNNGYFLYDSNKSPEPLTEEQIQQLAPIGIYFFQGRDVRNIKALLKLSLPKVEIKKMLIAALFVSLAGFSLPIANALAFNIIVPLNDYSLYWQMIILLFAALVSVVGFEITKRLYLLRISLIISSHAERSLWDRLLKLPLTFFSKYSTADIVIRAQAIDTIRDKLDVAFLSQFFSLVFTLSNLVLLIYFDYLLALIPIGFIIFCGLILKYYLNPLLKRARILHELFAKANQVGYQYISAMDKIKLNRMSKKAFSNWLVDFEAVKIMELKIFKQFQRITIIIKSLSVLSLFLFFMCVALQSSRIILGNYIAFLTAFMALLLAVSELTRQLMQWILYWPGLERANAILQSEVEKIDSGVRLTDIKGQISVNNLCFCYPEANRDVLRNVSFKIEPGECVILVGASGCGKSTLFKCLLGLLPYQSGEVLYDEMELTSINLTYFRRNCGTVMQNTRLFSGSIYDNIRAGSAISYQEAMNVCQQLGLSDWIESLPMKLNTIVTGGHATFSGGQQQSILLARAIANQPKFLFLDEATSAFDNTTQKKVITALAKLDMTRFIIAHRLSTIKLADRILVMDEGKIVQEGKFEELINQAGVFQRLVNKNIKQEI